jgi:DNA-binding NarL/FixJ family response regulator
VSIRVLIADDQAMVRAGFRLILESEGDIEVVGEAEDGAGAVAAVGTLRPDVVLMDIQMPVMDGIAATRRLLRQDDGDVARDDHSTRVLILTTFERDEYIFAALRAGASGFLLKNAPPEDLIDAVRVVAAGDALLAPSMTRRIIAEFAQTVTPVAPSPELDTLTERERDTLRLVARGLTNAEIAARLFVGESTVKTHVSNVLSKLGLRDRVQAVVFAYESGLVRVGE